jgi:hypothetical protein
MATSLQRLKHPIAIGCSSPASNRQAAAGRLAEHRDAGTPAGLPPGLVDLIVGFLLFPQDWWETAADMPIQLALLQGGSSAFRPGLIAP